MSSVVFQVEKFSKAQPEIADLCVEHYEEIANHKDTIPLDPDWERYRQMEDAGMLSLVTAREEGKLVGYSIFFIAPHMHYKSTLAASNDVVFLKSTHREGSTGIRLIKEAERVLQELGVHKVVWHVKPKKNFGVVLQRLGYQEEEQIWGRILGSE